jgi:flavin reductase (DIM6/NTAB) family NADH-FMN oxidoreductase RutF
MRPQSMDPKTKQKVLRLLTNGMYILTSRSATSFGAATVTWVSQASFKPPLLMVALRKDGSAFQCVVESRTAALHVLDCGQRDIAQKFFAATTESQGLLNGEPYAQGTTDAPVLENLGAYLECKALEILEKPGDHAIVVFEVLNAVLRREIEPLTVTGSPWQYGG